MDGLIAAAKLLNGKYDIETVKIWFNWEKRAHLGPIAENLIKWLIVELDSLSMQEYVEKHEKEGK